MKKSTISGNKPVSMDITPLIDCVFLLIVFFIAVGKFKKVESKLNFYLPKDGGIAPGEMDPDDVFISLLCMHNEDANKMVWKINDREVYSRTDLVRTMKEIRDASGMGKNIKVSIDGDPQVDFFWIISSIDACAAADLTEVMFAPPRMPISKWPRPRPKTFKLIPGKDRN